MSKNYENVLVNTSSPFALTESFKAIRTNMLYTGKNEKCPVFGVTSSDMDAGKSIVLANIAQSFAQLGKKVVLLDCDIRKPVQHKIFQVKNNEGISELLAGISADIKNDIIHTHIENLDIITAGHIPPNPSELLASDNFKELLDILKDIYDVIFVDFPPVGIVVDAIVPAQFVTSYIIVVRCGRDKVQSVEMTLDIIENSNANIAGFVLNDVNIKSAGVGHYRYTRYGRYGRYSYGRYGYRKYGYENREK